MFSKLRTFLHCTRGVAAMEFAIAAPVLITLFLGTSEMSRYLLVHAKAEKVAYSLSDLISQSSQSALTTAEITQLMDAAAEVMSPFPFGTSGTVIISSIGKSGNNAPTVVWRSTGGGSLPASSQIGNVGATATLPYGFTMLASENVIVAEVYYSFTPMLGSQIVGNQTIYKTAYFKPRLGSLTNPPT